MLTIEAMEILNYVNRDLSKRNQVGYQREILDSYIPNQTHYLPKALKFNLKQMGKLETTLNTRLIDIIETVMIDLSYYSSRFEGNTYSFLETENLLLNDISADNKLAFETQMILNHKNALKYILKKDTELNRYAIQTLHSILSENLLKDPSGEGTIRSVNVHISDSAFTPVLFRTELEELFHIFCLKLEEITDPFEKSFFTLSHLPYLQPFIDVNKRTSRLASNIPLLKNKLCPLSFVGVDRTLYHKALLGFYETGRCELLRDVFVDAYRSSVDKYIVVSDAMSQPNPLRFKYRELILECVKSVVLNENSNIKEMLKSQCQEETDLNELIFLVQDEIARLHEGSIGKYGLTLKEFEQFNLNLQNREV